EVDGSALPTLVTWLGWGAALAVFVVYSLRPLPQSAEIRHDTALFFLSALIIELWFAAQFLPYNDLTDPAIYDDTRFAVNQMRVYGEDQTPPGRLLTISGLLFDPGDRA